ncbi:unnamed protein product [Peronospora belbahrii]|uniref:Uncharacterized protein n=1 Tax=Peronospora belbahrii TaxID=622444 RepID=A0AAU9KZL5_9STRA|nr:unnamed protein product [Peronospora belbahrii]
MLKGKPERLQRVVIPDFVNSQTLSTANLPFASASLNSRGCLRLVAIPGCLPKMKALKDDMRLAFEPPQDEHNHRLDIMVLKQDRLPMMDYIQQA